MRLVLVFAFSIMFVLSVGLAEAASNFTTINASSCETSDGSCQLSTVQLQDGVTQSQAGHNSAVRFIETTNSNSTAVSSPNSIDNVTVYIDRFESANPGGQTITLQVRRPSDSSAASCILSPKLTNNSVYDGCDATSLVKGSGSPESDAEGLVISYRVQALGKDNSFFLDHSYVNITYNDTSGPVVVLDSPPASGWRNSTNVTFQFTPNDVTSGINSCVLILDGLQNQTNSSITENQANYITSGLSQGSHNWTVNCTDDSANRNVGTNASVRNVSIDLVNTTIQLDSPANVTNSSQSLQSFNFTATDNLAPSFTCRLYVNGTNVNSTTATNNTSSVMSYGLPQGRHRWYVECEDLAVNINVSETRNITVDLAAPSVSNITHVPATEAELDPVSTVNVTANVSDSLELHSVILQFRLEESSAWNETNMTLQSGNLYLGRFNATAGNWSFRVFANDTANNTNVSSATGISVLLDTSWENSTVFSSVKSIVQDEDRFFSIGNITVNNTGDYDLNFTINSSQTWIDFNGTTGNSISFRVNRSYNFTILNVTANTTGFAVGEFNFNVTIFAFNLTTTALSSQRLSGKVVIQNVAGPFFTVTITNFDSTVTQGDTGVNLSASIKNDGTGDATEAWLAWTLPSGWTNTSGVLNRSIGILGVGTTVTNDITATVSSTATTGTFTLLASGGAAGNATGNDTKTVTVSSAASSTPSPAAASSGGGGGGGGGAGSGATAEKILSGEEFVSSTETFNLVRGTANSFPIKVSNIFQRTTLQNISVIVEGILPQFVKITPSIIDEIKFNETKIFNVEITSPVYAEQGARRLEIIITGRIFGAGINKDFTEKRNVNLIIHAVGGEEVQNVLKLAIGDVEKMSNVGFPTGKVSKLLDEARAALEENNFDRANKLIEEIRREKETAFEAYMLIQEVRTKASSYISITGAFLGVARGFPETEELANLAMAAFEREDFATALERAKSAKLTLALEGQEFSFVFFLVDYWWLVLTNAALVSAAAFFGYRRYVSVTISQRIINLEREENNVRKMMREAQVQHFQRKLIGPGRFKKAMRNYERRIAKIVQLRLKLRHTRARLMNPQKLLEDLKKESNEITNILKRLQREYFERRTIGKSSYDEQVKVYQGRLSEIEDERMTLETQTSQEEER